MCIVCNPGLFSFLKQGASSRREFFKVGGALGSAALLPQSVFAAGDVADTIFINAAVVTMNPAQPEAQAIAVRAGRIVAVGSTNEITKLKGSATQVVDLAGKTLLPGFVDPHMHYTFAFLDSWLDLGPFANHSMIEVKSKLVAGIAAAKPGDWVMGQLFDPTITPGEMAFSLKALDELSATLPIFILEANGHIAHANSAAFKAAGITKDTPNPPHGRFVQDAQGQLTGEIQETTAIGMFAKTAPHISGAQYLANVNNLFAFASSKGCTTLHDCGIGSIDPEGDLGVLRVAMTQNPPIRMSAYLVSTAMDTWKKMGLKPDNSSEHLRINGVKAWVDGTNQGGSGFQREPYLIPSWKTGTPNYSQTDLNAVVRAAHDAGWQVGIHANGDAGIDMALNAFDAAQTQNPKRDMRHRIEHSTVCHPQQLEKMKTLGVSPSFLIGHVYYYGAVFRDHIFGVLRANLIDPCRTALEKGLRISLHSDYNCQPIEPLRYIHNAVTRNIRHTNQQLNPAETITVMQAIRAVTLDAAWQCQMDDIVGSVENGKCADFVILEKDPRKVPPMEILNIAISATWMNGVRRYAA